MKKVIIFGTSGFARITYLYLKRRVIGTGSVILENIKEKETHTTHSPIKLDTSNMVKDF